MVSDLVFPTVTVYLDVPAGDYNFKVVDSDTQSLTAIDLDATVDAGIRYTVLAVNDLANLEPLVLTDELRSIATESRVRIVHASPTAGAVDIYVTAPGADITSLTPAFANVPFKGETGFVPLAPGTYDIKVTPTGVPGVVAIAVDALVLSGGDVLTAIARDNAGGGMTYKCIRTERYKYIHWVNRSRDGELDELYDLNEDPFELVNLNKRRSHLEVRARLQRQLRSLVTQALGL